MTKIGKAGKDSQEVTFLALLDRINTMFVTGNLEVSSDESYCNPDSGFEKIVYETFEFTPQPQRYEIYLFWGEPAQINVDIVGQVRMSLYA